MNTTQKATARVSGNDLDYMSQDYDLIQEPLNLLQPGQRWFAETFHHHKCDTRAPGLVLGATEWLARLLATTQEQVVVADMNSAMIDHARTRALQTISFDDAQKLQFVQCDWLALPCAASSMGNILGDNCFSFLSYPSGWANFCHSLANAMQPDGVLITRFFSVPLSHVPRTPQDIVRRYIYQSSVNYTEVRAELLFSVWNSLTSAILTEAALERFESSRSTFDELFKVFPAIPNDLLTVSKYRNTGATYWAPRLDSALDIFKTRFRIKGIHFGPYALGEYFPVVVGCRR
jgi:SAM-dependent methyltransferase